MNRSHTAWIVEAAADQTLDWWIQEYLGEASVDNRDKRTVITVHLEDLAAVYGFILKLRDLDIRLESLYVKRKINY